ncbi:MAG: Nicotinamide-nucleotide amidase [uncultured Nocardioidaceae bacterium]|uniref:Nicotinamide-nucleotide amidase n=1 Tax=uncultured Nocardioidaceae bacterium TaxID=253824 RepID=A0A6J4N7H3_9ACTN|nr:MAG: Nicotinamide-nucleotide amidase [uncultured Nocardioidaceae bacterium]
MTEHGLSASMAASTPTVDHRDVADVAAEVVRLLRDRGYTVATAESLTGGLVCAALTDVAGSSAVVRGGLAAYATEVKRDLLGISGAVIDTHGVVSEQTAAAMAQAAVRLFASAWAVATTGVAGPVRLEDRPVGTVHIAVAGPAGDSDGLRVEAKELRLDGSRTQIRTTTVAYALRMLADRLRAS